ncbi:MAG TPA: NYN domain-containing protein [Trebonia sp.]
MDRCALFVDAGYVLADGAMAVHGTRRRESVSWDYAGLLQLFGSMATERTRLPLLRCYWYEATVEGRRSADHDTLADLPGVKLRVAKMRPGRREGVEGEIHRDLTTLARNKAVSDVMVVSAEEDLAQVIADVQDMGMRVTLLNIAADGNGTASRALRQECDDFAEISAAQLRPYVELISGAEPPRPDEADAGPVPLRPVMNGGANGANGNGAPAGRAIAFAPSPPGPQGHQGTGLRPPVPSGPQPVAMDAAQADRGQPERVDAPAADFGASVDFGANVDFGAAADYAPAVEHGPAADQPAAVDYGSALEYGPAADYAPAREYAGPAPMPAPVPVAVPREDIYAAPVALPVPTDDIPGERDRDRTGARPRLAGDLAAYNPGAVREQFQRDGMLREMPPADNGDRLQPVPVALPGNGPAQVRRLPTRGAIPGAPNPGQPAPGLPPAPPDNALGQQPGPQQLGGQPTSGQPTGGQPAVPVAPVVPMDYQGNRGAALGGPRHVIQGPAAPGGPGPQVPPGAQPGPQVPPMPQVPQVPPMPQGQGGQPAPVAQPELSAPSGPIGLAGPGPGGYSGGAPGVSLADAVQSAHEEGQAFGESVARDAPALWLEAVLARKPRMPSDLEARLLQGSALPIDFLLHDEVRHALRRGFWDALERARR